MSRFQYLEQLSETITDPEKIKYLMGIPESILAIVVQSYINESEYNKLKRYPLASKIRVISRYSLVDYNSPLHKKWQKQEEKFKRNADFIPYPQLMKNNAVLEMARTEYPSHPHTLGGDYGIQVIGAIPKKQAQVDLLISHSQYKWSNDNSRHYGTKILDTFDSKEYKVPSVITTGELKKYDPGKPMQLAIISSLLEMANEKKPKELQQGDLGRYNLFFSMPPLDTRSDFFDVTLP